MGKRKRHANMKKVGMAGPSFAIPRCADCGSQLQKDDEGAWVCLKCADEWLKSYVDARTGSKSIGGVHLPAGARDVRKDEHPPSFKDLIQNRRTRRALARAERRR